MAVSCCSSIDEKFSRNTGFRVHDGKIDRIVENIHSTGTTYFVSPEGKKDHVRFERVGFALVTNLGEEIHLPFLEPKCQLLCFPFGGSDYWVGVVSPSNGTFTGYNPGIRKIESLIVFSPTEGVIHQFQGKRTDFLFPRTSGQIYIFGVEESLDILTLGADGHVTLRNPTQKEKETATIARKIGADFFFSLACYDIEQVVDLMQQSKSNADGKLLFTNESQFLKLKTTSKDNKQFNFSFVVQHRTKGPAPCDLEINEYIILEPSVTIANDKIWYLVKEYNKFGVGNRLSSIELKNCAQRNL